MDRSLKRDWDALRGDWLSSVTGPQVDKPKDQSSCELAIDHQPLILSISVQAPQTEYRPEGIWHACSATKTPVCARSGGFVPSAVKAASVDSSINKAVHRKEGTSLRSGKVFISCAIVLWDRQQA
jgi:hypothetical protein